MKKKRFQWNTRTRMKVFIVASIFAAYLMWYVVTQYPKMGYQTDIAGIVWALGGVWFGSFASVVLGIASEKIWGKPENINPYMMYQDTYRQPNSYIPSGQVMPGDEENVSDH